jgi:uncharacterized protein YkwD
MKNYFFGILLFSISADLINCGTITSNSGPTGPISNMNYNYNINNIPYGCDIHKLISNINSDFYKWIGQTASNFSSSDYYYDYESSETADLKQKLTSPPPANAQFVKLLHDFFPFNNVSNSLPNSASTSIFGRRKRLTVVQMTAGQQNYSAYAALNLHNYYRTLHANTSNLTLNSVLNQVAQNYSYQLAYVINNSTQYNLVHSYNSRFGENLFLYCQYGSISNATLMSKLENFMFLYFALHSKTIKFSFSDLTYSATAVFYNEIQYYNWSNPRYASNYGHFTQIVWASTGFMGVGVTIVEKLVAGYNYSCALLL